MEILLIRSLYDDSSPLWWGRAWLCRQHTKMMMLLSWQEAQSCVNSEKSSGLRQQPYWGPVLTVSSAETSHPHHLPVFCLRGGPGSSYRRAFVLPGLLRWPDPIKGGAAFGCECPGIPGWIAVPMPTIIKVHSYLRMKLHFIYIYIYSSICLIVKIIFVILNGN